MNMNRIRFCLMASASAVALQSAGAFAQASEQASIQGGIEDIVVTAQKRSESVNKIGMSITAVTGNDLADRGVVSVSDLPKIVPGFVYSQNRVGGAPIYTIRGVGFDEGSFASTPTVSVYTDEVPLPFPRMTTGASLDLERVEVLKGPQGTLFGQNSTGGAINFIAAKPQNEFGAGLEVSYGRFNTLDANAFVTGPIASGLSARVAVRVLQSGDWQESYVRDDSRGQRDQIVGRLLLQWEPSDNLTLLLNVNGWKDKSDPQAPQMFAVSETQPGRGHPSVINHPLAPRNTRAADWTPVTTSDVFPGMRTPARDDSFYQFALRGDYDFGPMMLTSITAYQQYDGFSANETDGIEPEANAFFIEGRISSFNQELRLSGEAGPVTWILGANYQRDKVFEDQLAYVPVLSSNTVIPGLPFHNSANFSHQDVDTKAIFGNVEYALTDTLTLQGAARYTRVKRDFEGCAHARGDLALTATFEFLQAIFKGPDNVIPIGPYDCLTLDANVDPALVVDQLDQDNVSWRAGVNWNVTPEILTYANISQGYKSGGFPTNTAATASQYVAVNQESILAYEAGVKARLFDGRMQLNGAVFYYDYKDKQFQGTVRDPVFGPLSALVNIPKSRVIGAEFQVLSEPISGLSINLSGTYIDAKIKEFVGLNPFAQLIDFKGSRLPLTPRFQAVADMQYSWGMADGMEAFVGTGITYATATNSALGYPPELEIPSYALVDLRAGIERNRWRLSVWGRNVTNEYYFTTAVRGGDNLVRYTGMPVTYGITLRLRFD